MIKLPNAKCQVNVLVDILLKKHQFGQIYLIELANFKFNLGFIRITHEIC